MCGGLVSSIGRALALLARCPGFESRTDCTLYSPGDNGRIQREGDKAIVKTIFRNHMLPVRQLPLDVTSTSETEISYTHETSDAESDTSKSVLTSSSSTSRSVYVPPHKRKPGEP
ncbi:hypothetical protein DPMN_149145 [Dreissena polymorpha]|uniref:Uncharacterized protein n=1 Tax=Dreissena polymorpha TaxID=45954 RepID=A0A9D4J269_DREPO|nr:hypothetical protein DPMN_149145 [Dreissena polymorpha]